MFPNKRLSFPVVEIEAELETLLTVVAGDVVMEAGEAGFVVIGNI